MSTRAAPGGLTALFAGPTLPLAAVLVLAGIPAFLVKPAFVGVACSLLAGNRHWSVGVVPMSRSRQQAQPSSLAGWSPTT